jgi:hypothetical protein
MAQAGRAARMAAARERDGDTCVWCGAAFDARTRPTREHVIPRVKGGPSWLENEVEACRRCNGERGHRALVEWLDECERRGWSPDVARLERVLVALQAAIGQRGGQRRARPQLDAQLRRLRKRVPQSA